MFFLPAGQDVPAAHPSPCSAKLSFLPQFPEGQLLIPGLAVPRRAGAEVGAPRPLGLWGCQGAGKHRSAQG